MDTNQYMDMFLDESHEHLQSLNDGLLSLEDNMQDTSVVNEIFRNAHTLKGMSATMGYNKIAELTHEMEDVLDLIRKDQLDLNEDIIDTLFKCVDSLGQMIDSVGKAQLHLEAGSGTGSRTGGSSTGSRRCTGGRRHLHRAFRCRQGCHQAGAGTGPAGHPCAHHAR